MAGTRASYDAVAGAYAEAMSDELRRKPLDRALLTVFAEQVRDVGQGAARVWDVGCGPGHVTAFLAGLGLRAAGVDLSDGMVAQARKRHPDLEFSTGSMTALPAPDASWDGLVSFYSLIHMIDDADLRAALAEYRRVLADGGLLLLAVHAGQEVRHSAEWFGAEVDVSFRFFDPAWLSTELERAGFAVESLTRRQPYPGAEVATRRAYFLARAQRLRPLLTDVALLKVYVSMTRGLRPSSWAGNRAITRVTTRDHGRPSARTWPGRTNVASGTHVTGEPSAPSASVALALAITLAA